MFYFFTLNHIHEVLLWPILVRNIGQGNVVEPTQVDTLQRESYHGLDQGRRKSLIVLDEQLMAQEQTYKGPKNLC